MGLFLDALPLSSMEERSVSISMANMITDTVFVVVDGITIGPFSVNPAMNTIKHNRVEVERRKRHDPLYLRLGGGRTESVCVL